MRHFRWFVVCFVLAILGCALPGRDTPTPPSPTPTPQPTLPPSSEIPGRTEKEQPTANTQHPTPNTQHPTPNPSLPDWTVMLYFAEPSSASVDDLVGESNERVNILVQTIVTQTERYELQPNNAQLVGQPTSNDLSDFLAWGLAAYPANNTALLIYSRNTHWLDTPALIAELEQAGSPRLDVIGLDSADMAYLDVFQALQPFARYAVAPAGASPFTPWDYTTIFNTITSNPNQDPATFATHLSQPGYTALNLQLFGLAGLAIDELAQTLTETPHLLTPAGIARQTANLPHAPDAIDLAHFASLLTDYTPSASRLQQALQQIILSDSPTVAHYFPANGEVFDERYEPFGSAQWQAFLTSYSSADFTRPGLQLIGLDGNPASPSTPLYLVGEWQGQTLPSAHFLTGRYDDIGRRLVAYQPLAAQAGIHEERLVWDTTSTFLSDGVAGDFVVLWSRGNVQMVPGRVDNNPATLIFTNGKYAEQWIWYGNSPYAVPASPGDTFQLDNHYLNDNGSTTTQPGLTLTFDATGQLYTDQRPLSAGNYFVGWQTASLSGEETLILEDVSIDNTIPPDGLAVYLSPRDGFQFHYPAGWTPPTYTNDQLHSQNPAGDTHLTITTHPGVGDPRQLLQDTLAIFGDVDVLHDDTSRIAGVNGLSTAYGYSAEDGSRTGLLAVFVKHGAGYVIDIDGPAGSESETITTLETIQNSWLFRPVGEQLYQGRWGTMSLPNLTLSVPISYQHSTLNNGWQLFSQEANFVALRTDPLSGESLADVADRWLTVASDGVSGFERGSATPFYLAGAVWQRLDFGYTDPAGQAVAGFVMATEWQGQEVVTWAESPDPNALDNMPLLMTASGLAELSSPHKSLHEASLASWPTVGQDGFEAYANGSSYEMVAEGEIGWLVVPAGDDTSTGIYQLTASHTSGTTNNGYGLLYQLDDGSAIVFEISSDGFVWIGRCTPNCEQKTSLVSTGWFASPAINQGLYIPNTLRLVVASDTFLFVVNGQAVGRVTGIDPGRGNIALFIESLEESPTHINFHSLLTPNN